MLVSASYAKYFLILSTLLFYIYEVLYSNSGRCTWRLCWWGVRAFLHNFHENLAVLLHTKPKRLITTPYKFSIPGVGHCVVKE
jgi:hypothetical protein